MSLANTAAWSVALLLIYYRFFATSDFDELYPVNKKLNP